MAQQTAVEWLIEQLVELDKLFDGRRKSDNSTVMKLNPVKIFKQAKQMEKEQSKQDYDAGLFDGTMDEVKDRLHKNAEQYYNETYNK